MRDVGESAGPLDVATLGMLARRVNVHPLVDRWTMQSGATLPRRLELRLDVDQYPASIDTARLDVRWFEGATTPWGTSEPMAATDRGSGAEGAWQCRWDRHPKPEEPRPHFHPSPDASAEVVDSEIGVDHHLDVLFTVLDRIEQRIESLHRE